MFDCIWKWLSWRMLDTSRSWYELKGPTLRYWDSEGRNMTILLDAIDAIAVETTDLGPSIEDVFWRIMAGDQRILVPHGNPVFSKLLEVFQRWEGFDSEAFSQAMGSTDCAEFRCWTRIR